MSLPDDTYPNAFLSEPPALRAVATEDAEADDLGIVSTHSPPNAVPPGSRAVIYLRVSSKGQVNTDYDPEGISIPAQRIACQRKAEQLGLTVTAEYIEPGRSATEMTKRVAFQQMLERIRREKDVDYVIVHKLSRFARNRIDDAVVMADLQKRGVELISATESIDATPVGQLMHGILAAFNEYRSREDGADIAYKMGQKAKNGGTLGKAPLGYLNVTDNVDGRKINTVAVDPERAAFVKLAFELYADRNHTIDDIVEELTDRGLRTRPTLRRPAGPVSASKVQQMLRDRYYLGEVGYKGEYFEGRHEPLIDEGTFNRVQELMDARGNSGERRRRHDHYLKGTIWCGRCRLEDQTNRRMIIMRATGRQGSTYWYFFCRGTQDHLCDAPYSNTERVEAAIEEHYKTIQFRAEFVAAIRQSIEAALTDSEAAKRLLREQMLGQLTQLETKEENLLDLAADGALPQAKIRERLRAIARDRERLTSQLGGIHDDLSSGKAFLDAHLELLTAPHELYRNASDETRRLLNQAIFAHIYVVNDEVIGDELNSPLAELLAAERGWSAFQAGLGAEAATAQAHAELTRRGPQNAKRATFEGDPFETVGDLLTALDSVGDCSKPSMVPLEGLEPPTCSLGRSRSSIELQRLAEPVYPPCPAPREAPTGRPPQRSRSTPRPSSRRPSGTHLLTRTPPASMVSYNTNEPPNPAPKEPAWTTPARSSCRSPSRSRTTSSTARCRRSRRSRRPTSSPRSTASIRPPPARA